MNKQKQSLITNNQLISLGFLVSSFFIIHSCVHDPLLDPYSLNEGEFNTPGCVYSGEVCFESSVLPIFISSCTQSKCHDAATHEGGFVLTNYTNIVRKGIVPGNANESKLYKVLFGSGEDRMPPDGSLTQAQKDSIKAWINQGAKNTVNCNCSCDPNQFTYTVTIKPLLVTQCVGCHKPGSLSGNVDLSTYTFVNTQVANGKLLGTVSHSAGFTSMPPGSKLSDCQIRQITNWINAGASNN